MGKSKKKKTLTIIIIIILIIAVVFMRTRKGIGENISVEVMRGDFLIEVVTTGELEAKNSEFIQGPQALRTVGLWNVQISDLVPEGTIVDSGDYVATLDRSEISSRLKDIQSELEKLESQFIRTRLDTTLELRNARDDLRNLKFALEEKEIILEQSKYEPPATIRQAELDLQRSQRAYEQAVRNYELRYEQAKANMQEITATLEQQKRRLETIMQTIDEFTITAPQSGMVIYRRDWDGRKITVGSQISTWNNVIATLPDFSVMLSKTYVNEIDISKIRKGQFVSIGIDAFPEKQFTGEVIEVANVGEQRPNSDSKVFEVNIRVNEFDSILRPAMTTKNNILTNVFEDVLYIPLEAVFSKDTVNYVYKTTTMGLTKQQIRPGDSNQNHIIVLEGLEEKDVVLLNSPQNSDKINFAFL